jgi:hypothetical protein
MGVTNPLLKECYETILFDLIGSGTAILNQYLMGVMTTLLF